MNEMFLDCIQSIGLNQSIIKVKRNRSINKTFYFSMNVISSVDKSNRKLAHCFFISMRNSGK